MPMVWKFYQIEDDGVKATAGTIENGLTGCLTETTGLSSKYALQRYRCDGKLPLIAVIRAYLDISKLSQLSG